MADEYTVSIEEARQCPECNHTGKIKQSRPIMGGTVHTIECLNQVCPWFETSWVIETDSNGEVRVNRAAMDRARGKRLIAPTDPSFDETRDRLMRQLQREIDGSTQGRRQ